MNDSEVTCDPFCDPLLQVQAEFVISMNPPRKRRRGEAKLTGGKLIDAMDAAISSLGSTELAVLQLFNHYDVDLDDLRRLLLGLYPSMNASLG